MKNFVMLAVLGLFMTGCHTGQVGEGAAKRFYSAHESVFGCPPHDWKCLPKPDPVEKKLDAVSDDCGKPVYRRPACPTCNVPPECPDGNCGLPVKKLDAVAPPAPVVKPPPPCDCK